MSNRPRIILFSFLLLFVCSQMHSQVLGKELLEGKENLEIDFDYSQGFAGLVRALRAAGAQSVLLSHGAADGESSRAFMEKFY